MDKLGLQTDTLPSPTAERPLLGLTVLVIEDSRYACEAMRLLCLRSGARIRRADCMRAARRHLQVYRPSVVIADLGLPDGDGIDLIKELSRAQQRVDAILAISGDTHLAADAIAAGADGFIEKPLTSLAQFQQIVLSVLPPDRQPKGVRALVDETVEPDEIAYQDDMAHIADVLDESGDSVALDYVAQFLGGVARSASDTPLEKAALALAEKRALGQPAETERATIAGLVQNRLSQRIAI
ncbi:Response regulator receiver domain-containing protein [Sulfitobacter marinus]|uniref:Response regulator receiver domain-containing protein n=1 Tax=Sulfitobacter marinus TaxID=394264 RepID=A0A1I6U2H3_9RHOB|nr:response regulator [Sulfitobacter marinus]SFS95558.1 Response regulator receiver domain-containing protein [Sulfitobacter marinus]